MKGSIIIRVSATVLTNSKFLISPLTNHYESDLQFKFVLKFVHNNPVMDLSFPNDFDDINNMNEDETASIDDEFLSSDDEIGSNDDDNPSIENVDMMDHHNEGEFTFAENIYETMQIHDILFFIFNFGKNVSNTFHDLHIVGIL
ncbi:unnamed protein product [Lactuca virosa]|uniref:Uncharacterized protein n=1 Tax=Lactuca virosa TaxID=75947 RepID=A0AAU9NHQ1_9ASTR|nr:unnamed protein product [Lactuca virosa]